MGIRRTYAQALRLAMLAGGLLCIADPAAATNATGAGRAIIVRPLSFINISNLNFGSITPGPTASTVTIDANSGARTRTGSAVLVGTTASRASFMGMTDGWGVVQVVLPATTITLNRAGGGGSMTANLTLGNMAGFVIQNQPDRKTTILGDNVAFVANVGGTLNVAANQAFGSYSATFNIVANYF